MAGTYIPDSVSKLGLVRVFSGIDGSVLHQFKGDMIRGRFAAAFSAAGDLDNDGYADLVIGSPYAHLEDLGFGFARIILGADLRNDVDLDFVINSADPDDDNDGMPDAWELANSLNPLAANGAQDADGDEITNLQEFQNNLDPHVSNIDPDGDGIANANDNCITAFNSGQADHDGDGLGNACDADDDNDSMPDNWELTYGLDRFDATDANLDLDGDLATNLQEYQNSFNPSLIDNDADADQVNDLVDNCPLDYNPNQVDIDKDKQGNVCDPDGSDQDGDGSIGSEESLAGTSDNDGDQRPYWWFTLQGDHPTGEFGESVSDAGDVNGDGYGDVIVGARSSDYDYRQAGSAYVFSSIDGVTLYKFLGDDDSDFFGNSVSGAGDVNGDGYDDLIVGASGDDGSGTNSGQVKVFSGLNGSVLYIFNGDGSGDYFGNSVSGAGDVNNDGYDDFIVGASEDDNNGSRSGSARIFSGLTGSALLTVKSVSMSFIRSTVRNRRAVPDIEI